MPIQPHSPMGKAKVLGMFCSVCLFALIAEADATKVFDKKCFKNGGINQCLSSTLKGGPAPGLQTAWDFPGKFEVAIYDPKGEPPVPRTEVLILYRKTLNGWTAIVSGYIPTDFYWWPGLRPCIFNPQNQQSTVENTKLTIGNVYHPRFRMGKLFKTSSVFLPANTKLGCRHMVLAIRYHDNSNKLTFWR